MKFYHYCLPGLLILSLLSWKKKDPNVTTSIVSHGQMPNAINDKSGNLHLVYGNGDSILYCMSTDGGRNFSKPSLVAKVNNLMLAYSRGPQIAATEAGITVMASNTGGDIFSFTKTSPERWSSPTRVNDIDTVAKEGLMSLSGDKNLLYAVWLDLRGNKRNKIVGASSTDGGKTWSKNKLIYSSPDSTVCECCKPSVYVKNNTIKVMFRNWLQGNRDLYLIQSLDNGVSFGQATKLGTESWALNGCPMDGGGITVTDDGKTETVWRRKATIYAEEPGKPEKEIGEGKSCVITAIANNITYAWVNKGEITCLLPGGSKVTLGKGSFPVLKPANNKAVLCVWEDNKQIKTATVALKD
ncbi:sialidase family protein [Danxiaibacter flavus]|uniref:Sialidase family protein n=1 Tax=Danxiaibacter flavus TaxID=3049108 RepID=A0ABV3ZEM4_9BACT|nr:sialidase family protein [Chitinophagaceae bacterium DXS]